MDGKILEELMRTPGNNVCAECQTLNPRWASYNIGVFLCVRCAGMHRNLGSNISKIKSLTLDSWTFEQIQSLQQMGNVKAAAIYLKMLPKDYPQPSPSSDSAIQQWIKAKYERREFCEVSHESERHDVEYMEISVSEPETEWDIVSNKGKYTTYLIIVSTNVSDFKLKHFSLRHRYKEFLRLYHELEKLTRNTVTKLPPFPPKTFWKLGEDRFAPKTIEYRVREFTKFLEQIAQNPQLRRSAPFKQFLNATS